MMRNVIEFDQVSLGWRDRIALRDVTGAFAQGSLTAIVGPNGAGKSTLIKGMMGLLAPLRGRIRLMAGRDDLACLPQAGQLDNQFPVSVYDMVALGAWRRVGAWKRLDDAEHERVLHALETVHMADFAGRMIGTLSGGQLQRALFARLMLQDAQVMLLDEPFTALDQQSTDDLMALIQRWHQMGRTVIVVLHDLDKARECFPQTLLLGRQVVAWGDTEHVLTAENLHQAQHLCAKDYA